MEKQMRVCLTIILGAIMSLVGAGLARADEQPRVPPGKALAFAPGKGNCLACHGMPTLKDVEQPGNSGPPLIAMSARFPNKTDLRAKIWDATASQANSFMPPFGKHRILTEEEINLIVDFIHDL
jgi:L-cysteine S-thiosulfotransferase